MLAYTYLLKNKVTGQFYYGVRYAKGCKTEEFWKVYFTSSKKLIPLYRTLFGNDCWDWEIRKEFNSKKKACEWEHKVLRRMKVLKNPDLWLNRTDNKSILNKVPWNKGKVGIYTEETKYKMGANRGKKFPNRKKGHKNPEQSIRMKNNNPMSNSIFKISARRTGLNHGMFGKNIKLKVNY